MISDQSQEQRRSLIYVAADQPAERRGASRSLRHHTGTAGRRTARRSPIAPNATAITISTRFLSKAAEEKRLTTAKGLDDGPDYSHDGQYIYFNSERTGLMQVWRMKTDGSEQTQITRDEYNNWFPHPSPDGKWLVFLSYEKDVKGHPANKDVMMLAVDAGGRRRNPGAGQTLRRPGHDQRAVMVARQPTGGVCQLSLDRSLNDIDNCSATCRGCGEC